MTLLIALDEAGARWAADAGLPCLAFDQAGAAELEQADTMVLGPGSLVQLRGLRATGNRVPAVLVGMAPDRRAELEPVAVVSDDDDATQVLAELTERSTAAAIPVAGGIVDLQRRCLIRGDDRVVMTQLQVDLLAYLAHRADRPVPREELLVHVWGMSAKSRTRTVDMAMSRLRKLVERDPLSPTVLLTCQGSGYRYVSPAEMPSEVGEEGLVGRDALWVELGRGVQTSGVVLLHGPAGMGKSRLACRFAAARGGVVVSLEGVTDDVEGAAVVASALGVGAPDAEGPSELLQHALATAAPSVLVLDGADGVMGLLGALPAVRGAVPVVVTARLPVEGPWLCLPVEPLDDASAVLLLRGLSPVDVSEADALAVVTAVGGLPLALEVAAARMGALGPGATARDLLAAEGNGAVPRAIRASVASLPGSAVEALQAMSRGRAGLRVTELSQILDRDAVEDWVLLHGAGLLLVTKGVGTLLPPVWETVRALAIDAALVARHRRWLFDQIMALGPELDTSSAPTAVEVLAGLEADGWAAVHEGPLDERAAQAAIVLDALAEWRGAPKRLRRPRLDGLLVVASEPAARSWLLCRRAEILPAADWPEMHRDIDEARALPHATEVLVRLAIRRAVATNWSRDPEGALEALQGALALRLPRAVEVELTARRAFIQVRSSQLDMDAAAALLMGAFEQLRVDGALRGACEVAQLALTVLRVGGTAPDEDRLAFAQQALASAEHLGDPAVVATMHLRVAEPLTSLGRRDDTLASFAAAEALFERVDPLRCVQVAASLGRVLTEWGDITGARYHLGRYLNWSDVRGMHTNVADAALWLVSLEGDAGDFIAMLRHAERARHASGVDDPHLRAHADLGVGHALVLLGRHEAAAAAFDALSIGDLSPVGVVTLWTCRAVLARLEGRPSATADLALEAAVADRGGAYGDAVREITSHGLGGGAGRLPGFHGVEERLLVRTWARCTER